MKPFKLIYKAERETELVFVPFVDPLTQELFTEIRNDSNANVIVYGDIGNGSSFSEMEGDLFVLLNCLRKLAFTPFYEQWEELLSETSDDREQVLDCLRSIARVDYYYFGARGKVFKCDSDVERYAKVFFTALLSVKTIREFEKRLYRLDNSKYEIHFDVVNREVIISKPAKTWLHFQYNRKFGIEGWRKLAYVGSINFKFV